MLLSKTKLNLYSRLGNRKQREKLGLFLAEGEKCVADTIGHFSPEAILASESWAERHGREFQIPILTAGEPEMRQISQFQTLPEVIAVYRIPKQPDIDEKLLSESLTLLLDAVQDPGNLGTILRIASWFGIDQVVLGDGCADPYNPKAVQSSMGAVGMVRIVQHNLASLIAAHPEIPVCGTLLDGTDIYTTDLRLPHLLSWAMKATDSAKRSEIWSICRYSFRVSPPDRMPSHSMWLPPQQSQCRNSCGRTNIPLNHKRQ